MSENAKESHTPSRGRKKTCTCSQEFTLQRGRRDRLVLMCAASGLIGGAMSVFYRFVLTWAGEIRLEAYKLANTPLRILILFAGFIAVGMIVGKITQGEPLISGSGIPQVEAQLQGEIHPNWVKVIVKKFVAGALCILCGLSLGREGPSIQLGAMTAQGLAEKTKRSEIEKKYLVASGACAGLAGAFNAPLAGVMFGLEEIHKNFSKLALLTALLASIASDLISKAFYGTSSALGLGLVTLFKYRYYWVFVLVGVIMGFVGALYNFTLIGTQKLYRKLPIPVWMRIVIPFICAAGIGFFLPEIMGGGHDVIEALNAGKYTLGFMVILLLGKFLFSMISYSSGAPGGIFFPLLVIGSLTGGIVGKLLIAPLGLDEAFVVNFMLLGMVGMFAGVVRAPVTGIVLVTEMSGSLTQLAGLTIVAATASIVADYLKSEPIYESLLKSMQGIEQAPECSHEEHHVIEIPVSLSSPLADVMVRDITWPANCLVISVLRGGRDRAEIPKGDTVIRAGDTVFLACPADMEPKLRNEFLENFS